MADALSIQHINESLVELKAMRNRTQPIVDVEGNPYAQSLIGLALKVKTRKF
jgi:hypothetical protein